MTKKRQSVATIDSPEFINITKMSNPLISKCEVKVLYVGENRNGSFISKDVAKEMAQTLPGCPIVGWYIENKEDFGDHGDQIIFDGEGIRFNTLTKPYGFVAPDSKIWFQKFNDTDEFGNEVTREYLMTEGYLWTGQFEEAKRVIENGNPQSMELDEDTLKGHWATNNKTGIDFFIINDAIFSKLCILGEDVEPCFEGASVTAPSISSNFSKETNDFIQKLSAMVNELKFALNNGEGGNTMTNDDKVKDTVDNTVDNTNENFSNNSDKTGEPTTVKTEDNTEKFKKSEEDDEKGKEGSESSQEPEGSEEPKKDDEEEKDKDKNFACGNDDEEEKKKYSLLETEYNTLKVNFEELQSKFTSLETEYNNLMQFKKDIEDNQKEELINSFYMLSNEDKKDVIENKANYSLDEIKAKLSIICVDKKVDFSLGGEKSKESSDAPITYNLNDNAGVNSLPAWLKAVEDVKNSK